MAIQDTLTEIKEYYQGNVKPHFAEEQYLVAGIEMGNIDVALIEPNQAEFRKYHSGPNFVLSARSLQKRLMENNPPGGAQEMFEAMLAQVGMSIETGNMFGKH